MSRKSFHGFQFLHNLIPCGLRHRYYSPALVYYNNLGGGREDYVSEASSHEMGHNLGLSHDGTATQVLVSRFAC